MSRALEVATRSAQLRQRALAQLSVGPETDRKRVSASNALAVLHQLASSPSTAGDALALLHELQVHQVELDLQQEELRSARYELETTLVRQSALFERAPVGYMSIDAATVLCEINLAGSRLLGATRDELLGRPLSGMLWASSVGALQDLLARARNGLPPETCELRLLPQADVARVLHAAVDTDTTPGCFLVVLMAAAARAGSA